MGKTGAVGNWGCTLTQKSKAHLRGRCLLSSVLTTPCLLPTSTLLERLAQAGPELQLLVNPLETSQGPESVSQAESAPWPQGG